VAARAGVADDGDAVGRGFIPGNEIEITSGPSGPEVRFSTTLMPTYALTTSSYGRRSIFNRTANAEMLVQILFRYRDQGRYRLHGFAVMPEHLHVLLTPAPNQTIERCAQCIKGGYSHELGKEFGGEVWQAGFHEHRIRDRVDFINQLEYIAANPEKRGLADYAFVHTKFSGRIDGMPGEFLVG
jgi:putative transposase